MTEQRGHYFQFFEKRPVFKYGVMFSGISCIFGIFLFFITADIISYGNYNNLGGEVALQFYFMSIVFTMMAAYLASRDFKDDIQRTKKERAKSGIKAALIATFIPGIIYWVLDMILSVIFKYPFNYNHFLGYFYGLQIFFVPVPALIFGGLVGYFIDGTRGIDGKESINRFILILSAIILVEMIVFLVALYLVTGMELVPHDGGYLPYNPSY